MDKSTLFGFLYLVSKKNKSLNRFIIKNALKQVYGNQYTDIEYLSIAWQGLKNTTAWSLLPQAERDLYEQTYQNNYNLWEK